MKKLESLEQLACKFFNITLEKMRSRYRSQEFIVARHVFRAAAIDEFNFTSSDLIDLQSITQNSVDNSKHIILRRGQFKKEYEEFVAFAKLNNFDTSFMKDNVVVSPDGIERITDEAFDTRFYKHPEKVNTRTGNHFFPAFHFLTSLGAPENAGLGKWKQDKGHFADYILAHSAAIGTFVHDSIDNMIKHGWEIKHETIHQLFTDEKEAQRIKECLLGFLTFMSDQEPEILSSEAMVVADDFAFTMDLKCKIKEDGYKGVWVVDWKTSKVATDDHKMQVEVMRKTVVADKAAVVVLGNGTKKGYTFSPVQPSKAEYLWKRFCAIRNTAYVEILERGLVKPRENNMPSSFSLKNVNYTKNESNKV